MELQLGDIEWEMLSPTFRKSIKVTPKKRSRGRPPTGGKDPARTIRLSDEFIATVDTWAARQDDLPSRSESIRRLVELGLAFQPRQKKPSPANPHADYEFLQMAEQFFGGYKLIPDRHPMDFARYFLFCHAIEVGLKAYLIKLGDSADDVKNKFGHDLARLLLACKKRGLAITDHDVDWLSGLSETHKKFWARYPKEDWSQSGIPTIPQFEAVGLKVLDAVAMTINGAPMIRSWQV